jgi:hypothetical protein
LEIGELLPVLPDIALDNFSVLSLVSNCIPNIVVHTGHTVEPFQRFPDFQRALIQIYRHLQLPQIITGGALIVECNTLINNNVLFHRQLLHLLRWQKAAVGIVKEVAIVGNDPDGFESVCISCILIVVCSPKAIHIQLILCLLQDKEECY